MTSFWRSKFFEGLLPCLSRINISATYYKHSNNVDTNFYLHIGRSSNFYHWRSLDRRTLLRCDVSEWCKMWAINKDEKNCKKLMMWCQRRSYYTHHEISEMSWRLMCESHHLVSSYKSERCCERIFNRKII